MKKFLKRYPHVNMDIVTCGEMLLSEKLLEGAIDLALGAYELNNPNYERVMVTVEQLRLLVPQSFGITPKGLTWEESFNSPYLLQPEQLSGVNCIEADASIGSYMSRRALEQQYNIIHGNTITVGSADMLRKMIAMGWGYGYVSVHGEGGGLRLEDGTIPVVACTLPGLPLTRYGQAAYSRTSPYLEYIREFIRIFQENILLQEEKIAAALHRPMH